MSENFPNEWESVIFSGIFEPQIANWILDVFNPFNFFLEKSRLEASLKKLLII